MYKCPNCNNFMKFNMTYNCGQPCIFYTCVNCGFNTAEQTYTATTTTEQNKLNYKDLRYERG